MWQIRRFFLRLFNFFRPAQGERELEREIRSHLVLLEDEFRRRGMTPEQARTAAQRAFGNSTLTKEYQRAARSFVRLDDVRRDLRYAFRSLRRTPGFSAVAILTLALGIGASTVVFSFVNGVLLKPLNYPDGERLVTISPVFRGQSITVTPGDFLEWQAQSQSFS